MLRIIAPAGIGGFVAQLVGAETTSTSPFLTLGMALLGSSLVAAFVTAMSRRRSGEDRGAAAESVGHGADAVAQGSTLLLAPLNRKVLEQTQQIAELEAKLAASRREEAERAIKMADLQGEMLAAQRDATVQHDLDRAEIHQLRGELAETAVALVNAHSEIETLKIRFGAGDDRREGDRRTE